MITPEHARQVIATYCTAETAKDRSTWLSLFAPDATLEEVGTPAVRGLDAARRIAAVARVRRPRRHTPGPGMSPPDDVYTHGHHESVLRSHRWRTAENSAGYLLDALTPGTRVLDVGCGPGTITVDFARAGRAGRGRRDRP